MSFGQEQIVGMAVGIAVNWNYFEVQKGIKHLSHGVPEPKPKTLRP